MLNAFDTGTAVTLKVLGPGLRNVNSYTWHDVKPIYSRLRILFVNNGRKPMTTLGLVRNTCAPPVLFNYCLIAKALELLDYHRKNFKFTRVDLWHKFQKYLAIFRPRESKN